MVDSDGDSIVESASDKEDDSVDDSSNDPDDSNVFVDGPGNKAEETVAAEVIVLLKTKPISVKTIHDADLHDSFLDQENRQSHVHDFGDTTQILVGDNNSVCYPVGDDTIKPIKATNLMDQEKKKEMIRGQKATWGMWKTMKGNAILPRE